MVETAGGQPEVVEAPRRRRGRVWSTVAAIEVVLAIAAVVTIRTMPALYLLGLAAVSLLIRREGIKTLGFTRAIIRRWRMAAEVFALTLAWTIVQLGLTMPILNHLMGEKQDLSDFKDLQGNVGMLLGILVLSWTLAAIGEELVFRGYIQTRVTDVLGASTTGIVVAVLLSSVLFGLIHTEQGLIGVVITFLDAVFFSALRIRYKSLWASVSAHGITNTIGMIAFFLVGPFYGLW